MGSSTHKYTPNHYPPNRFHLNENRKENKAAKDKKTAHTATAVTVVVGAAKGEWLWQWQWQQLSCHAIVTRVFRRIMFLFLCFTFHISSNFFFHSDCSFVAVCARLLLFTGSIQLGSARWLAGWLTGRYLYFSLQLQK